MTTNRANLMPFERLMTTMTRPWFVASYLALIVICFIYIDQPVAFYFQSLDMEVNVPWLESVTAIGKNTVYLITFFSLGFIFRYIYKKPHWEKRAWFLWLCVFIPNLIALGLKIMFGRSRPRLLFEGDFYGFYGFKTSPAFWSFPSGHTTTVVGLAFGLCVVFPRYAYMFIIAALVAASTRIMLTHHFLSDVLMAAYLAFIEVAILYAWFKRYHPHFVSELPVGPSGRD